MEAKVDRLRVLVVDDDSALCAAIRRVLEQEGHEVRTWSPPDRMPREVARRRPDVVILDVHMPGVDGLEVARAIRQRASLSLVLFSAMPSAELRFAAQCVGADDVIIKGGSETFLSRFREIAQTHGQRLRPAA